MADLRFPPQLSLEDPDSTGHGGSPISADQRALMVEMQTPASPEEAPFSISLDDSATVYVATKDGVARAWAAS